MAGIPKEHTGLYFDNLCRTQKSETVLSLIHASYHASKAKSDDLKAEIAKRLEYAYKLFRNNLKGYDNGSGSYVGTTSQFDSQYTIGHELCIWKDSKLQLNDLAIEVAENKITIKDYFDIIFLNYFQPVSGKAIHPLYLIMKYMVDNNINEIDKKDIPSILSVDASDESINALCNFLDGTNYINYINNKLVYVGELTTKQMLSCCNQKYVGERGLEKAKEELSSDELYAQYIISNRLIKLANDENKDNEQERLGEVLDSENEYEIVYEEFDSDKKRNRIIFGAPGTGKSFTLNDDKKKWLTNDHYFERVTFHPDYSYANFVGTYKPVLDGLDITYKYVPGPFMRVFTKAIENPKMPCLLIIEEINRAQIAAVFGDVFQLLDRDEKGISEYEIATSEDLRNHLCKELQVSERYVEKIRIPSNMFIWATMNSADQGVFPMDTAFKRRWEFEYIDIDREESKLPKTNIAEKWNVWRKAINDYLTKHNVNEDKLMGPFFISKSIMEANNDTDFKEVFKNKVLMYLFEDAGKRCRDLFSGCLEDEKKRYSKICKKFDDIGMKIFDQDVWKGIENII